MIKWLEFQLWFKRELKHGELMPRGYGWAGYDERTEHIFVMPMPINMVYSGWMWFYYEMVSGFQSCAQSYTYKTGLQLGQFSGYKQGYMAGYTDCRNKVPNKLLALPTDAKP